MFSLLYFLLSFIKEWSIYNIVLVSSVQYNDSYTYLHIFIYIFQILFPYKLLQNIEYHSLCYTVGPYYLFYIYSRSLVSILYIAVCVYKFPPSDLTTSPPRHTHTHTHLLHLVTISFSMWVSLCFVNKFIWILFHLFQWYHTCPLPGLLNMRISRSIHVARNVLFHSFLWLSNTPLCMCTTSLSILLLMDI